MSYPLVLDLAADGIPVAVTCRVLGFSTRPGLACGAALSMSNRRVGFKRATTTVQSSNWPFLPALRGYGVDSENGSPSEQGDTANGDRYIWADSALPGQPLPHGYREKPLQTDVPISTTRAHSGGPSGV
jgi:hypothetical protein